MLNKATRELAMIDRDIKRIRQRLERESAVSEQAYTHVHRSGDQSAAAAAAAAELSVGNDAEPEVPVIAEDSPHPAKRVLLAECSGEDARSSYAIPSPATLRAPGECKAIIQEHYADLQACYFDETLSTPTVAPPPSTV